MRRGTWILALSGAVALHASGAFAADPFDSPEFPKAAAGKSERPTVPTRYSRGADAPAASAAKKNFYEELFADEQAAAAAKAEEASAPSSTPAVKQPSVSFGAGGKKRPVSAPPAKQIPFEEGNRVFPASAESTDKDAGVKHAAFEKSSGSEQGYIQQVRATDTNPTVKAAPGTTPITTTTQTPTVAIEWVKKSDINVGQECQLELVVKNTSTVPATQVSIDAAFPTSVRLTSADPKPSAAAERLTWQFESLPAGAEKRILVKLVPSRRGDLGMSADVRFTGQAGAVFKVEEPLLKVAIKGAPEVMLGDPASQMVTVTNPGTGVAHDVKIEARLSDGLEHPQGEKLTQAIGSINPGETRQVRLGMLAVKGGPQTLHVTASSSSDATSTATAQVIVIAPSLKVAMDGPGLRYKGRQAKYQLVVTNDGSVPNNNVRASAVVPAGFEFVQADKGAKFDASQKSINWFLGRLEPGQSATVSCELMSTSLGEFSLQCSAQSDAGVRCEAKTSTRVEGTASLVTEIVDLDDPVEIGTETAWEVRVRNDGSMAANTIAVACELPPGVELLSAKGPTEAAAEKRMVLFKGLKQLAPGQQAVYRIHVRGTGEGVHRLRARVTSDSLDEPLLMEEATKFYADSKAAPKN